MHCVAGQARAASLRRPREKAPKTPEQTLSSTPSPGVGYWMLPSGRQGVTTPVAALGAGNVLFQLVDILG